MELNLHFKLKGLEELKGYISEMEELVEKINSVNLTLEPDESEIQPEKEILQEHSES